jgi:predicted short-subunit dehydrogenase-like oxidoreductase (DUF2520 family)
VAEPRRTEALRVAIVGRGKVGGALGAALRAAGAVVRVWSARRLPRSIVRVDLLVVAVRDAALEDTAHALAERLSGVPPRAALHTAGALGPSALAVLARRGVPVAQAHPLLSFASATRPPELRGAALVLQGDPAAVRAARTLARLLGMRPIAGSFDPVAYHAAAALVANGLVALVAMAGRLLAAEGLGIEPGALYAPLVRSVAQHLDHLGLPDGLSGPVRRGDVGTVRRHLEHLRVVAPDIAGVYAALIAAQLPMSRDLGEARPADLAAIARIARAAPSRSSAPRRRAGTVPLRRGRRCRRVGVEVGDGAWWQERFVRSTRR